MCVETCFASMVTCRQHVPRHPEALSGAAAEGQSGAEPSTSGHMGGQDEPGDNAAQSSTSSTTAAPDQDVIDVEGSAALATAWGRKLRDWAGADRSDHNRIYVVKPAAVGLAAVPGQFVFVVTGLPQAALSAFSLLAQVNIIWYPHVQVALRHL